MKGNGKTEPSSLQIKSNYWVVLQVKPSWMCEYFMFCCGLGSSVGIVTGYGLDGPGIESWWGARFSTPVQTGPGAQPSSCTWGTGSFLGVKSGRGVTLTQRPLLVPWSWKGRAIPLLPLWAIRLVQGCILPYFFIIVMSLMLTYVQPDITDTAVHWILSHHTRASIQLNSELYEWCFIMTIPNNVI